MSDPKLVSPMLDGFMMGDPISDHDGVRCCPAMKENSDDKYIVKIISVPASQKQLDALLFTGAYRDSASAAEYFKELADETVKEVRLLQQLSKLEGFLPYESWQIVPMEGEEVGYDVYLLGSYKRSLEKFLRRNAMTHLGAVNLGIDLCSALSLCRRAGFIYTDLKPSNIYITAQQEYRIGDLGFAKLNAMKYTSMPAKYIGRYTPPELHDPLATLNPTVDTYAVGMILYQIYNNGELPFQTKAPLKYLATPFNADYELAEIIQKAIDPNPRKRYQTPIEMGQALVSYMQRNTVNDTPIVPPLVGAVTKEPAPAVEEPAVAEAPVATEEIPAPVETEAVPEELRFMEDLVSDETAPDAEAGDDLAIAETTDEVDMILAQADALISHDPDLTPDSDEMNEDEEKDEIEEEGEAEEEEESPAEDDDAFLLDMDLDMDDAGETEEITASEIPNMDMSEDTPAEEAEAEADDSDAFDVSFDIPDSEFGESIEDIAEDDLEFGLPEEFSEAEETSEEAADVAAPLEDFAVATAVKEPKPRKKHGWVGLVITLLILALLGAGGWYYYSNYYLLGIDNMTITGIDGGISVELSTDADESLLKVICTDTYGNKQEQAVSGGKVEFTNLTPDTTYKILVEADGLHKATGSVSGSYTTAEVTNIIDFTAKSGTEDGSVVLNFTVDGPETQDWIIEYVAEGEDVRSVSFTGHMVTINDLTVGKVYTFTLVSPPAAELYLVGSTSLEHLASQTVLAENLSVVSFVDGVLTAQWTLKEGLTAESWSVRCYADGGYDETLTVTDTTARFTDLNSQTAYTVEVTAAGMSQSVRTFVTANPATVSNVQVSCDKETGLTLTWESDIEPKDGWLVLFSVDGSDTTEMAEVTGKSAVIKNVIPNAPYELQIRCADGATVFGGTVTFDGLVATDFNKYGLTASQLQSSMCHTPDKANWTHADVKDSRYTTSYAPGEKASLVLYTNAKFYFKAEPMAIMYVIRNERGQVLPGLCRTVNKVWREMWPDFGKYCYLDIPVLPTVEGKYTLEVYFNGETMLTKNFSIINANG